MSNAPSKRRGPSPETLKIPGNWMDANKHALGVPRPAVRWPKPTNPTEPASSAAESDEPETA